MNRRQVISGLSLLSVGVAHAQQALFPLKTDAGQRIANGAVPSDLDPAEVPGIVWVGASATDVVLAEYFDYNCPICRGAVHDVDALLSRNRDLKLGLVNNPILSPASIEAADVQQSVLRSHGPQVAYEFHKRLLSIHGIADHESALSVASRLDMDMDQIRDGARLARVAAVVKAQEDNAASLGFSVTPSFVLHGVAIVGWPGPHSTEAMITSVRACDKPLCSRG